jgi:hypothetical protein
MSVQKCHDDEALKEKGWNARWFIRRLNRLDCFAGVRRQWPRKKR